MRCRTVQGGPNLFDKGKMMAVMPSDTALGSTLQTPSKTSATTPRAQLSAVPDGDELAAIGRSENPQPPRSGRYRTEAPMLALAPPQGEYYIDRYSRLS